MEDNLMVCNFSLIFLNHTLYNANLKVTMSAMISVSVKATMAKYARHTVNANELIQLGETVYFVWHCGFVTKMKFSFLF